MFAETAPLVAQLKLDDKFSGPLKNAQRSLSGFDAKLSQTSTRAFRAGEQIGTGIRNGLKIAAVGLGLLATQVIVGLNQLVQLEKQTAQTNAALVSTGGISGQTADSIRKLAEKYENLNAVIDDKVIQSGENVLLTFTNIRKEAFEPALAAALDLSVAMGQDLQSSIVQIGKALNDPAKGFTALRRVGIQFTADQEKQIKALQESGDLLGAQKIILRELGTEFGGRFAAQGRTAEAAIAGIGDAVEDLQKGLATALFPTIQRLLPRLRETLASPQFAATVSKVGDAIAGLFSDANIEEGGRILTGLFKAAQSAAPALQQAAEITGQVVSTAVNLFKSLPPELQALTVAGLAVNKLTGGLVTNIAGGLISAVISSFKGAMHVTAGAVFVNGGAAGVGGGAAGAGLLGTIGAVAVPVTIAAISVTAATQLANADLQGKGLSGNLQVPGSGILPFGIESSLHNIGESIGILTGPGPKGLDRTQDAIERLRGAVNLSVEATESNTSAIPGFSDAVSMMGSVVAGAVRTVGQNREDARAGVWADRKARGLKGPFKRSTSLEPRFAFLRDAHSGTKDVAVANAIATGFERGATPLFRTSKLIPKSIKELERDQRQLLKAGDLKNAALVGKAIDRLKVEQARRLAKLDATIKAKELAVKVNVPVTVKQFINGRLIEAATGRFTSTIVGSRGAFREFG